MGGVAIVVQVKLDLAEAYLRELREAVEEVRSIFFAGKEPTVSRWPTVAISKLTELRVAVDPRVDARATDVVRSTTVQRFIVVAQREQ
jgi:hypothetical protein